MGESWCSVLNRAGFDLMGSPANSPWKDACPGLQENEAGTYLAGARHREGLTPRQLAEKSGIPQRHISEMESGKSLAEALNAVKMQFIAEVSTR